MKISYDPPKGKPLGVTAWFRFGAFVLKPLLNLVAKRDWRNGYNIPKSGAAIAVCNHISYVDPLTFTHFLYNNGRAVRYLAKASVFKVPLVGRVLLGAGQIPVERETANASDALQHAIAFLKAGHLLGVYPEGTLTRDANYWAMTSENWNCSASDNYKGSSFSVCLVGTHRQFCPHTVRNQNCFQEQR